MHKMEVKVIACIWEDWREEVEEGMKEGSGGDGGWG